MMEDKYLSLQEKGYSEKESIGIVISEFGNLDDLSALLGIEDELKVTESTDELVDESHAFAYLDAVADVSRKIGLGVAMCIISPSLLVSLVPMAEVGVINMAPNIVESLSLTFLLACIAIAVYLMISHGSRLEVYAPLKEKTIVLDHSLEDKVRDYHHRLPGINMVAGSVSLIILAVLPLVVFSSLMDDRPALDILIPLSIAFLLILVGIAVRNFIVYGMNKEAVQTLLQEDEFSVERKQSRQDTKSLGAIYWPLVTAGYLLYSFISGNWGFSWIIWPIAGIIYAALANLLDQK